MNKKGKNSYNKGGSNNNVRKSKPERRTASVAKNKQSQSDEMSIQWYPGHMTKTRRMIEENLKLVDAVVEIIDSRIPIASRNPDIDSLVQNKPRIIILNRADQADPILNKKWTEHFKKAGWAVLQTDCKTGVGIKSFSPLVKSLLSEQIAKWNEKGMVGRAIRIMVVGVPNVGKSTFINKISNKNSALAQNRPGVTRGKQWVSVEEGLELLDTPGILWPKFDDKRVGMYLAYTGAVKDTILDIESLANNLIKLLAERYPKSLQERYKLNIDEDFDSWQLIEQAGRNRGFLISGGEVDTERMSRILLEEFRSGKLGRFTLEIPDDYKTN